MLKKETIEKIVKIENNPFVIHILNKQNLNVKDLLMVMSLCGNKSNAEKIKNLVLPEIDSIKEPKKHIINKPIAKPEPIKVEKAIEPDVIEPEAIETEEIKTEEVVAEEIQEEIIENTEEKPVEEQPVEKPKKKGKKKKAVETTEEAVEQTEEQPVEEPKTEE